MCGRYALGIRAAFVRHQLHEHNMPVDDAPDDDDVRQTYNFAPGYHGLVYRADVPDYGAGHRNNDPTDASEEALSEDDHPSSPREDGKETKYKLQAMKWGLVPFWTKRNPDYGSMMKTINARDDSLIENRGMWNTMKQRKRCVVIAQGFYEWLKKNDGKEKIPHYTQRKDGQLMCFAGLWDCVQYEGSEEKLYTYTIITTDSNPQLKFLHDRMPVILDQDSYQSRTWLDPNRSEWSEDLQSILKPFTGELECYPVSKDVGKVGNNSPTFIIPISSPKNKNNIANFFSNTKGKGNTKALEREKDEIKEGTGRINANMSEIRDTVDKPESEDAEDNAPMPIPHGEDEGNVLKRKHDNDRCNNNDEPIHKIAKPEPSSKIIGSPSKSRGLNSRKTKSAISNRTGLKASPAKASDRSQRITNFFNK